ncbi:divergent polysaccharide deacetylase family protein [Herbivorax sp. ANBcel31]|uniref:divergent polysaccharide deacetylase family protein n=1 Tax=Herbivorax sp. ANBcel31 TaxID=3069754 RepID=UPI0027B63E51|nr:divergent polysaccharide deacetylase family protein [Herbivorax sp. ANBcel31]MDQ2087048.1 divergent polysaccharide deacetylase family protein [Herbivorax sp. ANBcel31]
MKSICFITLQKKHIVRSIIIISLIILTILAISIFALVKKSPPFSPVLDGEISEQNDTTRTGKLAIVIDDFGSSRDGVEEMMSIEKPLTFAVMPFLPHSEIDAKNAHDKGYEVIVHLPMEPYHGKKSWLGPKPVMSDMDTLDVMEIVRDSIENIPYAKGLNNHMGSKATSNEKIVSGIMDVLKEKELYFLDSLTTDSPVGEKIAEEKSITYYQRDIFLDGQKPKNHIKNQLKKAGEIALEKEYAVAIGHVGMEGGKVTAEAISDMIPEFDKNNIQLVFVSDLHN